MGWGEKIAAVSGVAGIAGVAFGVFVWWTDQAPLTAEQMLDEVKAIRSAIEAAPPDDPALREALRDEAGGLARATTRAFDSTDAYIERVYEGVFDLEQGRTMELSGPDGIKVLLAVSSLRTANAGLIYVLFNGKQEALTAGRFLSERNCKLSMVEHRETHARFLWHCPQ